MSIILLSNFNKKYFVDNIQIEFVNRWFYNPFITADKIHFITGSVSIWVLMAIFFKGEKKVTLTDGDMFGEKFIFLRIRFDNSSIISERLTFKSCFREKLIFLEFSLEKS